VQGLVSKDRAVLKLRRRCAQQFRAMPPAVSVRWLLAIPGIARYKVIRFWDNQPICLELLRGNTILVTFVVLISPLE